MNPATSILFLGLVLSTAQGLQVKSFEADHATPPKGSQVKLTATPDGEWKTCTITFGTTNVCDITKEETEMKGTGATGNGKYNCFATSSAEGTQEEKIGNCGVAVTEAQAGNWKVTMDEASKALELKVGPANGAGIPQLGMAIWIQLASTFALYKVAF